MAAVFLCQRYLEMPVIALLLLLLGEELSETSDLLWGCLPASSHVVFSCCHTCLVEVSGILGPPLGVGCNHGGNHPAKNCKRSFGGDGEVMGCIPQVVCARCAFEWALQPFFVPLFGSDNSTDFY